MTLANITSAHAKPNTMNGDPTYWYRRRYDIQNDLTYEGVFIVVLDSCIATNDVIIMS